MNDQSVLSNVIVCHLRRRPAAMFEFHYGLWLFCCQICGPTVQRKDGTFPVQIVSIGLHCLPIDSWFQCRWSMIALQVQSVMYCRVRIGVGEHYIQCCASYFQALIHYRLLVTAI